MQNSKAMANGATNQNSVNIPTLTEEDIYLRTPLYTQIKTQDKKLLASIRGKNCQFDAFCVECSKESVFKSTNSFGGIPGRPVEVNWMLQPGRLFLEFKCQRETTHIYQFWFEYDGNTLIKCGQKPSLEDIAGADIRKYQNLLKGGYFEELKRASGLASHGIGIGSFVYLRRIFEKLIVDHSQKFAEQGKSVEGFDTMRMDEKIGALKDVLPPALVENKAAYRILSKGIHELDENTCRKYFPSVRQAIILILEQDLQRRQREEEAHKLKQELERITCEMTDNQMPKIVKT